MGEALSPAWQMKFLKMPIQQSVSRMALIGSAATLFLVLLFLGFGFGAARSSSSAPLGLFTDDHGRSATNLLQSVHNRTLGFEKIFVINLPYRFDHRDSMSLAARLTDLDIEYVDGVILDDNARQYLPQMPEDAKMNNGALGAYRAHMMVLRRIIEQNITSALVLEGDVDWDIRIKPQMETFARSSRMLLQPGEENRLWKVEENLPSTPLSSDSSPYGDINAWDLLWLGHCGGDFPPKNNKASIPTGRVEILNDITVPEKQHVDVQYGSKAILNDYPDHSRVVSRSWSNVCTLAYGISQPGAQKFFYELGLRRLNSAADLMFRGMCQGVGDTGDGNARPSHTCLTVQPQLFQHHRPIASKSTFSDIGSHGETHNALAFTRNIRWATRVNFGKLVRGLTDYIDLFRDGDPARKLDDQVD